MTDLNFSLLTLPPFVSHCSYTLWRYDENPSGGTPIKVPVHYDGKTRHSLGRPARNGKPAIPPNPAPPLSADQARQWIAYHRSNGSAHFKPGEPGYLAIGFRPEGTGLVCIDLDNCVTPDGWTPGAVALMSRFPGALIEQSVSGKGAHIWITVSGTGPGRRGKQRTPFGDVEVYGEGQFIAAGTVLGGDAGIDQTEAVAALVREFWPAPIDRVALVAPSGWDDKTPAQQAETLADVRSALSVLDPDSRDEWVACGQALATLGEPGYEIWAEWSATSTRFPGGEGLEKWDTFSGERSDYRAILAKAEASGKWTNPKRGTGAVATALAAFGAAPLPAGSSSEPVAQDGLSFAAAAAGAIPASIATVYAALTASESGVKIAYDVFKDRISLCTDGATWRPLIDVDYGFIREAFERRGFKPIKAETMQTAVAMVAHRNSMDSAKEWAEGLRWDGVPRIDAAMHKYYGCADTPYTRAVGAYLFTALAGRALVPGVKADMALILVGLQGAKKTTAVQALCPEPGAFGEVDLSKDDDTIARKLRGKMVVELAEMRGFSGRDAQANKAWVSRQFEEWTPKYREFTTTYGRRCVVIGTANDEELLDDPTGARRFLPLHVGASVDSAGLARDRDQLWAEGVARFVAGGVEWEKAETLAHEEHPKFEVVDERLSEVAAYLATPPVPLLGQPAVTAPRSAGPVRSVDILTNCFRMQLGQIKKADEIAIAKILKKLGYQRTTQRIHGTPTKVWLRSGN